MISGVLCAAAPVISSCAILYWGSSSTRKRATTSENLASCPHPAPWSTSAGKATSLPRINADQRGVHVWSHAEGLQAPKHLASTTAKLPWCTSLALRQAQGRLSGPVGL